MYLGQDAEQRLDVITTKAMVLPLIAFRNGAGRRSKRVSSHPSGRHRHLKNLRPKILKSTKPIWFNLKIDWVLIETELNYCSKIVFDRFLRFIGQFLLVLKVGAVLIFESLLEAWLAKLPTVL
jgi:hypothetical protein